ncbi:MAG: hypothetical protein WA624_17745 [Methylocella sp.]
MAISAPGFSNREGICLAPFCFCNGQAQRDVLRQGQAIFARLTKLSPDNAIWKQDLARFDRLIAELAKL